MSTAQDICLHNLFEEDNVKQKLFCPGKASQGDIDSSQEVQTEIVASEISREVAMEQVTPKCLVGQNLEKGCLS